MELFAEQTVKELKRSWVEFDNGSEGNIGWGHASPKVISTQLVADH